MGGPRLVRATTRVGEGLVERAVELLPSDDLMAIRDRIDVDRGIDNAGSAIEAVRDGRRGSLHTVVAP